MKKNTIYTHDEAMLIIERFENILSQYGIHVPSPEDDEREEDNMVGLYGSTYSDLLDEIERGILDILSRHSDSTEIIEGEFSGNV